MKNIKKETIINVEDLKVSFRSSSNKKKFIDIIRGVSFQINRGEIVGFIGESGSGKSVTAKSLFGMNINSISSAKKFEINKISMLDKDNKIKTKNKDWREIRGKHVTYIPQNPMTSLNPTMRICKQLYEVMEINGTYNLNKNERKKYVAKLLEEFGVTNAEKRMESFPHEFSGGMKQRVVIAMAILSKPDVIIADEPTTALDPTIQASVLKLLKDISIKYNVGIIFVSHDISVISTLCDYVNVFYAGRIIERGNKYDIFTNPKHPYTWALLSSMPELNDGGELYTLDGAPPDFANLPAGDAFSPRNKYALEIDFREEAPLFKVIDDKNHYAATWLLHPSSPKVEVPNQVIIIAEKIRKDLKKHGKE